MAEKSPKRFAVVHYQGRNPQLWPGVQFGPGFSPSEKSAIHDGEHVFFLGGRDDAFNKHVVWSQTGGFCYSGPALGDVKELDALLNKFTLLMGAALQSQIDLPCISPQVSSETSWEAARSSDSAGRSRFIRWRWSSSVTTA